ncbi:hypothetical protein NLJ89_g7154 [Agrocybe chaxingu]|uniref:Metallo-beta-lactamase domain-containing protein n=1 Tax=Agrocybe chaxingu TaxID=84603 RepID=A0A9W8JX79_9AGAR|nr:hypothetical protein NLJ89_g7154 [Agrocybe chaxingu]
MTESSTYSINVSSLPSKNPNPIPEGQKPDHWADKDGCSFVNPWKSWVPHKITEQLRLLPTVLHFPSPPKDIAQRLPIRRPTWGNEAKSQTEGGNNKLKATWLGHACFLVEFPRRNLGEDDRGVRVLFDPVFSDRCSPSQWIGPKRFTPPPCNIEDIPEVDAVVISHNHYDHLDTHTIKTLLKRSKHVPHFFAPLGNGEYFKSVGVPDSNTHIMDWWDSKRVEVRREGVDDKTARMVDITCTPGQHFTGRTLIDNFKSLWAGWAAEEVLPTETPSERPPLKVYFAGDTAYRTVLDGQDEDKVPVCPAFEMVGNTFGGAYLPRDFMSRIHCAPQDSVRLFKDIKAKRALGMHWGTWILTSEDVLDPPKRLAEECKKIGIDEDAFTVCDIGETVLF